MPHPELEALKNYLHSLLEEKPSYDIFFPLSLKFCLEKEIQEYFKGSRQIFSEKFTTPFKRRDFFYTDFSYLVFSALDDLSYGETISYGELASKIGKKGAQRALGHQVGKNSFPLLFPCHRITGKNNLGGFSSAMGIPLKEQLILLEKSHNIKRQN